MHRARRPLLLLAVLVPAALPAQADAATRCKLRDMPEPYRVSEPMPPAITAAFEIFRRPVAPADGVADPRHVLAGDVHKANPDTSRYIGPGPYGTHFFAVGATLGLDRMHLRCRRLLRPAARRREARWYRRMKARPLGVSLVVEAQEPERRFIRGWSWLGATRKLLAGRAGTTWTEDGEEGPTRKVAFGLVPDGVARIDALLTDSTRRREYLYSLPVQGNVWFVEVPEPAVWPPEKLTLEYADGRRVPAY
jgi:hypothetical protein